MTARKITEKQIDFAAYVESHIGSLSEDPKLWQSQVQKNYELGLVNPEFLLHQMVNIELFHQSRRSVGYRIVKRLADLALATLAAPVVMILFPMIALAIKLESKGPVFFKQTRIGFLGVPFSIWKFRTMYENSAYSLDAVQNESSGAFFKNRMDPRITRVGRILRRWSLDESPQFLNILFGDMSLVGPRPLPVYDVAAIPYDMLARFTVPPGLTGLWQVTARGSNDGHKNLMLDKLYAESISLKLDLWILFKTPLVVLRGTGAH